jgi:hypothetical protein
MNSERDYKITVERLDEKEESVSIEKLQELPSSCYGVDSTETWLYSTGQQYIDELSDGFYDWRESEAKKEVSVEDVETRAGLCMGEIAARLDLLCEDPFTSQEVCLMNSMQNLYRNMITN